MANMHYCRFRNTLTDLRSCYENWEDVGADQREELAAREKLLRLCKTIAAEFGEDS